MSKFLQPRIFSCTGSISSTDYMPHRNDWIVVLGRIRDFILLQGYKRPHIDIVEIIPYQTA